jgi:cytoskeletal protein RodZ
MPVGSTLSRLRREQGKTMAEAEVATKIMGRMLSALENERWDELPAAVYVKGYIQSYASFLGVDSAPLLEEYARDVGVRTERVERVPLKRIPERTVVPHRLDLHAIPRRAWTVLAAAVLVMALLVWGISALLSRDDTPTPILPETTSTPTSTPADQPATTGETDDAAATDNPAGSFVLAIGVAEGQSSWLQVTVDSLTAYEGTLPAGAMKEWTVTESAVVRVGKPAAVTITRDRQPVEIPAATEGIAQVSLFADAE